MTNFALKIQNLRKAYRSPDGGEQPILNIKDFEIGPTEQMALHGESGSGKTTFLNLIAGILSADSGSIFIEDQNMTSSSEAKRDRIRGEKIGYIFQTFNLLQGYSALENIMLAMKFGKGANRAEAERLIERVGLSHRTNYLPRQLSVGQQQRVAVARALANKPAIVLADEPTGNLDAKNSREVLKLIREICQENKAALLLVSHENNVLGEFDKRIELAELNRV